ncbi:MAG TPA: DNA polymerase III subunit delta [Candidatus Binatia bacterium]|nr:DNA polymerase III subunit delta [Candidatus Binatia bacterium]
MKRNLETIIIDIKSNRAPQVLLLFGDDLQVDAACRTIVDHLIPADQRGFNLERFDGHSAPWDQIEASLNTPPFFPGKKVVWVENVTYFTSQEQQRELGRKVLQSWGEGKQDEAARLLLDLLAAEGWTQEQWEQLESAAFLAPLMDLLEAEGSEAREDTQSLVAYCLYKGMELTQRRGARGHRLAEMLDDGLPPWDLLLMTAAQVDRRTRLYKRLEDMGSALPLVIERDRSGRLSRENLTEFIGLRLRQAGKTIESQAREMILLRAGDELRGLQEELEKLLLYVGEQSTIRTQDVDLIFADRGEGWVFDLTRAIGERNAPAALAHLARLLTQGEHPLKLLGTIAAEVRKLLAARDLLDGELRGRWKRGMSYQQFQQNVLRAGAPILTRNPYGDYMCFQRADQFSQGQLRAHLSGIHEADFRLKSAAHSPRIVMEKLILDMCLGSRKDTRPFHYRTGL